jgi:hypothetical protein
MRARVLAIPQTTWLWWAVLLGLLPALVLAAVLTLSRLDWSRECRGGFSSGFVGGFDRYRCELVIRIIGSDLRVRIPLP